MALEDRVLKVLGAGAITYDGLRAKLGVNPDELDGAIRTLEHAREIKRDRGRFCLAGAAATANTHVAQAEAVPDPPISPPTPAPLPAAQESSMVEKERKCNTCNETKPIEQFPSHPGCKGGHTPKCKKCTYAAKAESRGPKPKTKRQQAPRQEPSVPKPADQPVVAKTPSAASPAAPVMILHFADGVRIGHVHTTGSGVAQMLHPVDLSAEQLDELVALWASTRKAAA